MFGFLLFFPNHPNLFHLVCFEWYSLTLFDSLMMLEETKVKHEENVTLLNNCLVSRAFSSFYVGGMVLVIIVEIYLFD